MNVTLPTTHPDLSIGDEQSNTEAYQRLAHEVGEALKDPPFRLDAASLSITVGKGDDAVTWKIKADAHIQANRNKAMDIMDNYNSQVRKLNAKNSTIRERDQVVQATNTAILELGLENFDFQKEASNPKIGPVLLGTIAMELYIFLVEHGGATGFQYSQTLRSLELLNRYSSSQSSKKSQKRSSAI